jgi:chromosomal replication initiation ATPase DnaA
MTALDSWGREINPAPPTPVASELRAMAARMERLEAEIARMRPRAVSPLAPRHSWVQRLAETIADQWEVPVAQVLGRSRITPLLRPRFVLAWVIDQLGCYSLPRIAQMIGYTDHTSVVHARRRVNEWRDAEPEFAWATDQLLQIARRMRAEALARLKDETAALAVAGEDAP